MFPARLTDAICSFPRHSGGKCGRLNTSRRMESIMPYSTFILVHHIPQHVPTLGWPGTLRLKIWDVPLWDTILKLSERLTFPTYWNAATITQIAKQIGSQNRLVSSNLLTSMTTSTTSTTSSNTKWLRGNARPTLEEVWRSPLCTSPVLRSCSTGERTGTIIVNTGTGSATNTTSSSTWDHLVVMGNQIARWGGDHQRMLTHIQCANVCTQSIYVDLSVYMCLQEIC